jgi:hypothetical protein
MASHIDAILERGAGGGKREKPLSFIVIVPAWGGETAADEQRQNSPAIDCLATSAFLRRKLLASNRQHEYLEGHQHSAKAGKRWRKATCDTAVFFLQVCYLHYFCVLCQSIFRLYSV